MLQSPGPLQVTPPLQPLAVLHVMSQTVLAGQTTLTAAPPPPGMLHVPPPQVPPIAVQVAATQLVPAGAPQVAGLP
jgi:hypothetical protein